METFSQFDQQRAGSLIIERENRFKPLFILRDELQTYAEMNYPGNGGCISSITSAQRTWKIHAGQRFSLNLYIHDAASNVQVAVLKTSFWMARISIHFANGEVFKFRRPTIFTRSQRWYNNQYGTVLTTEFRQFGMKKRSKLTPNISNYKNDDNLLLMIFAAVHMVVMRKVYAGVVGDI